MNKLDLKPIPNSGVAGRILDSQISGKTEAVIVLPLSGKIEVLNELGARIWSLVDGSRNVREIAAALCDEYQVQSVQAEADTLEFLDDLARRGVITFQGIADQ